MNETVVTYQASLGLLGIALGCLFYSLGGRQGKWKRRFIATLIISGTVNGLCLWRGLWSPYHLIMYPLLIGATSLGYGADDFGAKVLRRSLYALAFLMSGLLMAITLGGGAWFVFALHFGVAVWSIFLGIKNPVYAAAEEVFVCLFLTAPLVIYPFITT